MTILNEATSIQKQFCGKALVKIQVFFKNLADRLTACWSAITIEKGSTWPILQVNLIEI